MNRSIKKTLSNIELESLFKDAEITDEVLKLRIKEKLFDNLYTKRFYLLKQTIKVEENITEVLTDIGNDEIIETVKNYLTVKDDLELDEDLKNKLSNSEPIAFFVGTGVSNLLGLPLWNGLSNKAIDHLKKQNYINDFEANRMKKDYYNPKQVISIFHDLIADEAKITEFYNEALKQKKDLKIENPYKLLKSLESSINKPIIKITTNIDTEWETELNKTGNTIVSDGAEVDETANDFQIIYEDFNRDMIFDESKLYKIHGTIEHINKSIMTVKDYVKGYRDNDGLKGFLERVFNEYNVVFLGVGLQEFEILEHCIKESGKTHYALISSNFGEDNLFRIKQNYYSDLNIKAIPYYKDFQGYERFNIIINNWIEEMNSLIPADFYDKVNIIDGV